MRGASESLAGRMGFIDLPGFDLTEVGASQRNRLWLHGGFPKAYLADDDAAGMDWRQDFIRTFAGRSHQRRAAGCAPTADGVPALANEQLRDMIIVFDETSHHA